MHDDVVPRLTPTSVRGLLKHLLYIRETWVKTHLSDDLNAITERAYHVWPTRLRNSFTLVKKKGVASARRLKKSYKKRIEGQKAVSSSTIAPDDRNETNSVASSSMWTNNYEEMSDTDTNVSSDEGVDVEGDLFFDPLDDPLNESDDEISISGVRPKNASTDGIDNDWVPFDEPPMESQDDSTIPDTASSQTDENQQPSSDVETPQVLEEIEEMPLPRMFIPGKIVHIYTHRGGYKAGE